MSDGHHESPTNAPKNIVICSDGTANTAVKGRGTNVFKLYEAVDATGHLGNRSKREQVAIYDDGVGTQSLKIVRVLAGAFGFGLARNVRQLYAELVRSYSPGDDIYMFGFSRGAFTVRTLAGFVDSVGILDPKGLSAGELNAAVGDLYREYRKKTPAVLERLTTPLSSGFRLAWRGLVRQFTRSTKKDPRFHPDSTIKFMGVWDTVDAVGFPVPGIATVWNTLVHRFKFESHGLPDAVEKAAHALAIDEARASFTPTLWDHDPLRLEQVWFAGVHSNVGGGYPKQGMSLVALDWMLDHAEAASADAAGETSIPILRFAPGLRHQYREASNVGDNLYDSRSGPAIYYRYRPRDIEGLSVGAGAPVRIHHTAIDRIRKRTRGYAPGNLPYSFKIVGPGSAEDSDMVVSAASSEPADSRPQESSTFSGACGFWTKWRQGVQVAFYVAQAVLIAWAVSQPPVSDDELANATPAEPAAVASTAASVGSLGSIASRANETIDRLVPWLRRVAENAAAPVPGTFVQKRIVRPMFLQPRIGLTFLAMFPLFYYLGLFARSRQETMDSNKWRRIEFPDSSAGDG